MDLGEYLDGRVALDQPVNIHFTGCHHSCAQHFIGDIGLLATKVGDDAVEGYHLFVGGGYGANQAIGREMFRDVSADEVPPTVERMLKAYMEHRSSESETFGQFVRRNATESLKAMFDEIETPVVA